MPSPSANRTSAPQAQLEVVDPRWLFKALGLAILAAAVLAYCAVCLLLYQGGWQRMLFPSQQMQRTPASVGLAFSPIRFDAATAGTPRLTGWWVPADADSAPTILLLHGAHGSLSDTVATLDLLHKANLNVFAIDYRGYGQSDGPHPTEARMAEDAAAALSYLVDTRHIPANSIVPYGQGSSASLAARLANSHPALPAFIVENPDPSAWEHVVEEDRSRLLPMRLLIRERFDLGAALAQATRPKLLIADSPDGYETARMEGNQRIFRLAPDPKLTVTFHDPHSEAAYLQTLKRFLDEYLPTAAPTLRGTP